MTSEVQSAHEICDMELRLLELELERPLSPLAIGGSMCWSYEIDDAIVVLRRSQLEGQLDLMERRYSIGEAGDAARVVFAAVEDRLRIFAEADRPVHARTEPRRLQTLAKYALLERVGHTVTRTVTAAAGPTSSRARRTGCSRGTAPGAPSRLATASARSNGGNWAEADGHAGGRGIDECTSCGELFESSRSNHRRCPKCRQATVALPSVWRSSRIG